MSRNFSQISPKRHISEKEAPPPPPYIVKMAPKGRNKAPHRMKRCPLHGEEGKGLPNRFFSREECEHQLLPLPLLECTQLNYFLNIFSEEHTLESSDNKVEQKYTHCTIDKASGMYYYTSQAPH